MNQARVLPMVALLLLLGIQAMLGSHLFDVSPPMRGVLPALPSSSAAAVLGVGDGQFLFRLGSLQLQHAGNLNGQRVPYAKYDYRLLHNWLHFLDRFDSRANITPVLAAFLFSLTQKKEDVRYLVDYLHTHGMRDPERKWRWLAQAVQLARFQLGDTDLALRVARDLTTAKGGTIPPWARQLQVFALVDMGEREAARLILEGIAATDPNLPEHERHWMRWYTDRYLR